MILTPSTWRVREGQQGTAASWAHAWGWCMRQKLKKNCLIFGMLRESSCPRARAAQWNTYSSSWSCCFTFQSELLEGISRCISDLKAGIPRFQNIYCEHRETAPISPHFFNGWGRSDTHTVCEAHEHQREKLLLLSEQDLLSICASLKAPLLPPPPWRSLMKTGTPAQWNAPAAYKIL